MALLNILEYPDPRLKNIARQLTIEEINTSEIKNIVENMFETMYHAQGVGLAAIQVNINLQIVTIDLSKSQNEPFCIINPKIIKQEELIISTEGCLSFPGISVKIPRHKLIEIEFMDLNAKKQNLTADGLLSICLQHEIDHLNGKTFFDYLSILKRSLLEKKLKKIKKIK